MSVTTRYALNPFPEPEIDPDAALAARFDEFLGLLRAARTGLPYSKARFSRVSKGLIADLQRIQHAAEVNSLEIKENRR